MPQERQQTIIPLRKGKQSKSQPPVSNKFWLCELSKIFKTDDLWETTKSIVQSTLGRKKQVSRTFHSQISRKLCYGNQNHASVMPWETSETNDWRETIAQPPTLPEVEKSSLSDSFVTEIYDLQIKPLSMLSRKKYFQNWCLMRDEKMCYGPPLTFLVHSFFAD